VSTINVILCQYMLGSGANATFKIAQKIIIDL